MIYEPVIGLEVHAELNTKTKMFCRCSADYFGKAPNTHTCPICLGLPGALPFTNEDAINKCLMIGLALNCQIQDLSRFERKNYFYPDLSKGYQISQYRWPFCINGWVEVKDSLGDKVKIRINRVHQEEDTAKLIHQFGDQKLTMIDFNRSGVPLVEIVTEPDFHDPAQIKDYAKKLQQIFRYLDVSDADMEKGNMRLEANVSVRKVSSHLTSGKVKLPNYRIELKNINSFNFMVAAVEYEIKRQIEALERGEKLVQETRGWDEDKKKTYLQRTKEKAHDYRYFPEPDIPEFRKSNIKNQILKIKAELPELPDQKVARYVNEYGLIDSQAVILAESKELAEYFEKVMERGQREGIRATEAANYLINRKPDMKEVSPDQIIKEITGRKIGVVEDEDRIKRWAKEALSENPGMAELYKKGKVSVIQALIGVVMRKSTGKANPTKVKEMLEDLLR